jgi:hypothetical protein
MRINQPQTQTPLMSQTSTATNISAPALSSSTPMLERGGFDMQFCLQEIKNVIEYKKTFTYYLVVSYDMARMYVIVYIAYWMALHYSYLFTLFVTTMSASILYIIERAIFVTLHRKLQVINEDDVYHSLPTNDAGTTNETRRPKSVVTNKYSYDASNDTVTYTF